MVKKKTHVKTTAFLPLFPGSAPFQTTLSLTSTERIEGTYSQYVTVSLRCSFLLTLFLSSGMAFPWASSSGKCALVWVCHSFFGYIPLLWHGYPRLCSSLPQHLLISLWPRCSLLFLTVSVPTSSLRTAFSALSWLCFHRGTASFAGLSCGRSVSTAGLAGASCSQNGRAPHLFPLRPPRSLCPTPSTETLQHAANTNPKSRVLLKSRE